MYAFGRIGILPSVMAAVHPRWKSPYVAVAVQLVVAVAVTFGTGFTFGPSDAFGIIGTLTGMVFALLYVAVNVSCGLYFWRHQRAEFRWWRHALIPVLGIGVLVPVFFTGAGIPVFSFIEPLSEPLSYAGMELAGWMILGLGYAGYLARRHPERLVGTRKVFRED